MTSSTGLRPSYMSPYLYLLVGVCFLIHLVDGFDLFVMGFATPYLSDFASNTGKGFLSSAGMLGMGIGSVFLGAAADRFGRRKIMIFALVVNTIGTLISATAPSYALLLLSRILTGIGLGAIAVLAVIIVQEFSPIKRRNVNIAIAGLGYSVGGIVVGLVAAPLMRMYDSWRSFFVLGAGISVLVLMLAIALIPESLDFLMSKGIKDGDRRSQRALAKLRVDQSDIDLSRQLPVDSLAADSGVKAGSLPQLLNRALRERTLLVWLMYGGLISTIYFVTSWTPQLITTASGDATLGGFVGTFLGVGGLLGAVLFGLIGLKIAATKIVWVAIGMSCVAVLAFGSLLNVAVGAVISALILGSAMFTASTAAAGAAPPLFPVQVRSSGFGSMMGIGRVGAILTPILAGTALQFVSPSSLYFASVVPLALATVAAIRIHRISRREALAIQRPSAAVAVVNGR